MSSGINSTLNEKNYWTSQWNHFRLCFLCSPFGVFSMWLFESVWCVVFFLSFFHGWWWHHTHPNRLHYCIKSLKVDITFLRLIIFCSAHFQQRKKTSPLLKWRNPGSYHSKMPRGLWWIGMPDWRQPETRRSSSWIQTQMVCGLPFGNQKSLIFQSTILMFLSDGEQVFRQGKEERFKRLKEFITPGCSGPLSATDVTKIPGNANCEAEHFESSSCLDFSWLDKPKTWCGDCQLRSISKGLMICTQKIPQTKNKTKMHPFWLFPLE